MHLVVLRAPPTGGTSLDDGLLPWKRLMRWSLLLLLSFVAGCDDPTGPILAGRYDVGRDCLGALEEIGRYPNARSYRIVDGESAWIRNVATGEHWWLWTASDLRHLDEDWEVCNELSCPLIVEFILEGEPRCEDVDAGSSAPDAG
jgi:hypothetical protein